MNTQYQSAEEAVGTPMRRLVTWDTSTALSAIIIGSLVVLVVLKGSLRGGVSS